MLKAGVVRSRTMLGKVIHLDKHAASATRTADGATAGGAGPEVAGRGLTPTLAGEASLNDVAAGAGRVDFAAVLASLELGFLHGGSFGEHDGGDAEGQEREDGGELHFGRMKGLLRAEFGWFVDLRGSACCC